jgi:uncharacterized membrane protein (UPF0127 family)/CheY-like chemotaxis protein
MRGLLGRDSLPAGEGVLLQPTWSIHTAFMQFPIDVVFMDRTLRVVKLVQGLRPWRATSTRHARAVLEMASGEIARCGIEVGNHLGLIDPDDAAGVGWNGQKWSSVANGAHEDEPPLASAIAHVPVTTPDGHSPHPINGTRVLVVCSDRRFRSVTAALLTGRGCAVMIDDRRAGIAQLARREGADVVVLDAGASLTAAARETAQIEALDPPVGVVVVGDEPQHGLSAMPMLPKWGSFEGLFRAIEHAYPSRNWGSSDVSR